MFGSLKDWRRVATRYDMCPKVFVSAIFAAFQAENIKQTQSFSAIPP